MSKTIVFILFFECFCHRSFQPADFTSPVLDDDIFIKAVVL